MNNPPSPRFAKGDTCYLSDGTRCEYVSSFDQSHVVYRIATRSYDGEIIADPLIVRDIFESPPLIQREEAISRLEADIAAKREILDKLSRDISLKQSEKKEVESFSKRHEALQLVDAFLSHRITHIISDSGHWGIRLLTFEEAFMTNSPFEKGMRLLSLFGKSNGDLQWRLSKYVSEGEAVDISSFTSFELASAAFQKLIDERANDMLLDKDVGSLRYLRTEVNKINSRKGTSFVFPQFAIDYLAKAEQAELWEQHVKLLAQLNQIESRLKELS